MKTRWDTFNYRFENLNGLIYEFKHSNEDFFEFEFSKDTYDSI